MSRYIRGPDGNKNLGWIDNNIEALTDGKYPAGPIRGQVGKPGSDGYGKLHITEDKDSRSRKYGFLDGFDLGVNVADTFNNFVDQTNGRALLVDRDDAGKRPDFNLIVEHQPGPYWRRLIGAPDPFYGLTTSYPDGSKDAKRGTTALQRSIDKGGRWVWSKRR